MGSLLKSIGLLSSLCFLLPAQSRPAPRRQALLIVNSAYRALPHLASPPLDRSVLEEPLRKAGFAITILEDRTLESLARDFDSGFLANVNAGDEALVFYTGYAVQSNMDNFLLPVDFDPQAKGPLPTRALSLTRIQQDLEDRKAGLKILFVDGAREAPELLAAGTGPGLAPPDFSASTETAVMLAAAPNQTCKPPAAGSAGLLASMLAQAIQQPGANLMETLLAVQRQVMSVSGNGQQPFFLTRVTRTFYFTAPLPAPKPAPPPAPADLMTKVAQVNRLDRQEYRFLPTGHFQMGCVPTSRSQDQCEDAEKPRHEVNITKGFWMAVTEVTVDAYDRFVESDRSRKKPPAPFWKKHTSQFHPVVSVSWDDAAAFCQWVGGRLPTEAEWEYAARAGKEGEVYPLNDENSRDKSNFFGKQGNDRYEFTAPVKSFDPNGWGLFDMAGNVWEWTADWYSPAYYAESAKNDPKGPETGKERVIRGGSFDSDPAKHLRISFRRGASPKGFDRLGFRCVLEDGPETRSRFAR